MAWKGTCEASLPSQRSGMFKMLSKSDSVSPKVVWSEAGWEVTVMAWTFLKVLPFAYTAPIVFVPRRLMEPQSPPVSEIHT